MLFVFKECKELSDYLFGCQWSWLNNLSVIVVVVVIIPFAFASQLPLGQGIILFFVLVLIAHLSHSKYVCVFSLVMMISLFKDFVCMIQ